MPGILCCFGMLEKFVPNLAGEEINVTKACKVIIMYMPWSISFIANEVTDFRMKLMNNQKHVLVLKKSVYI